MAFAFLSHTSTVQTEQFVSEKPNEVRGVRTIRDLFQKFSPAEKLIFVILLIISTVSALYLLDSLNSRFLVKVPEKGGSFTEGIMGSPRFINPLLSISDADRDLTILVYSGLMRATPDGKPIPDLAESYDISPDGLYYTFKIRDSAMFHDGTHVTADDIVFTIEKAQDPALKSPKRGNWDGIVVEKVDEKVVRFILKQPYAPFLENTTIGVIPKHIWNNASSDEFAFSPFNTEPIGSGPYKIDYIKRNSAGIPTEYHLKSFKDFALGEPYIQEITLKFFPSQSSLVEAYQKGTISSASGVSSETTRSLEIGGSNVMKSVLPRVFGVFFNQSQAQVFTNIEVRKALNVALDKQRVVDEVLFGYGRAINSPVPKNWLFDINETQNGNQKLSRDERIAEARSILERNDWTFNEEKGVYEKKTSKSTTELSFTISTGDAPELKQTAMIVKEEWEAIGAKVNVLIFETGDLNQNVIRPRKYDALFFGEIIGRDLDLYAFWHSSQRNDPGLNIAMYANIESDKWLEDARTSLDDEVRRELYEKFQKDVQEESPVVFVYSPDFLYLPGEKIDGIKLGSLTTPSERFLNVYEWYKQSAKIWKIFSN